VIKTLTLYKASNREIAERLNFAESTVKLHMYNICNKIGVDKRYIQDRKTRVLKTEVKY